VEELKVVDSSLSESESSSDDNTFSSYDSSVDSREFRWTYKLHQKQEHLNQLVLNQLLLNQSSATDEVKSISQWCISQTDFITIIDFQLNLIKSSKY